MSVRTIRFNNEEENVVEKVLSHYSLDFSSCVKDMFAEKLEDLKDIELINKIKEGKKKEYFSAEQIDSMFDKKAS